MPLLTSGRSRFIVGGRFSPAKIAGLQLWLKADAITGLNDGDSVTTWLDSSGNGRDATQAAAGEKPTYKTGIINSLSVVRFDGNDRLINAALSVAQPLSLFVVAIVSSGDTGGAVLIDSYSAAGGGSALYRGFGGDSPNKFACQFDVTKLENSPSTANWTIHSVVANGANSLYKISSLSSAVTGTLGTAPFLGYALGNVRGNPAPVVAGYELTGDIAEVIIYNSAISAPDRQKVEAYLSAKYGITLA